MARGLLIIRTLTPTHPGAGTSTGAIDLMLQREITTKFPFVQGSSIKGAIRSFLEAQLVEDNSLAQDLINFVKTNGDDKLKKEVENLTPNEMTIFIARTLVQKLRKLNAGEAKKFEGLYKELDIIFGPYDPKGELKKGALTITDASLLFYPVRSLKGLYALVTCPEILRRLNMPHIDLKIPETLLKLDDKSKMKALNTAKSKYEISGKVYFEDLNFGVEEIGQNEFDWIKKLGFNDDPQKDDSEFRKLTDRLFIVHDDVFQYFVEFATQVMSRNRISYETGVVKTGALWTEEHLPPETYLFSYLEDDEKPVDSSQTAFKWLESKFNPSKVIHLGGDETVGKGFVELNVKSL